MGVNVLTLNKYMIMHITKPQMYSLRWKNLSSWRNALANMRSLTLVWWFTSASFLRRSSTIWSWPYPLAIYNAVWPVCACIKNKEVTFNCNHVTQHLFTATSWFCVAVMQPKVGEEPGNRSTSLYNFFLISHWLHGVFPCALLSMTI